MLTLSCPACGAALPFKSRVSVFAVCSYCAATVVRHDLELETLGKMAALPPDTSPLQIGTAGQYDGKRFELVGRLKISWEDGTWNEWYALFDDGRDGWLAEAQGFLMMSFAAPAPPSLPAREDIRVGMSLALAPRQSFEVDEARDQVQDLMRVRRLVPFGEPNNFGMETAQGIIDQFRSITAMTFLAMFVISSVGLLIGGIGVMNIMLVSVTERTKEIGIRKAVGATKKAIVLQFLLEAMTLTFFGGILGVTLAVGISNLVMLLFPSLPASIPLWAVISGLTVSVGVGLIFGVLPARKAARLDPIECLRYE